MGLRGNDGNMKELWDFNRSSVKSYLFFLIYLAIGTYGSYLTTPEVNQLEMESKGAFTRACFTVRNKEGFSHS